MRLKYAFKLVLSNDMQQLFLHRVRFFSNTTSYLKSKKKANANFPHHCFFSQNQQWCQLHVILSGQLSSISYLNPAAAIMQVGAKLSSIFHSHLSEVLEQQLAVCLPADRLTGWLAGWWHFFPLERKSNQQNKKLLST